MMKIDRNGQGAILSPEDESKLFAAMGDRDRALFGICLYAGCRISEARQLRMIDLGEAVIVLRRENTKGKRRTRSIPIAPRLRSLLDAYEPPIRGNAQGWLFPSPRRPGRCISRQAADRALRDAADRAGLVGISTHSMRRTGLTRMSRSGVPLRTIQSISGHASLATLAIYLETTDEDRARAIAAI